MFQLPWELARTPEATVVLPRVTVMPPSLAPKPEPETVIELPGAALA